MIPSWTLAQIENKVRLTTGRPDASMMSTTTIYQYINNYYQLVLPKELKIFFGYTYYTFFAQPNIDQYPAPANFVTVNPQAWADGWPLEWYLSPDIFYQDYPQQVNKTVIAEGDNSTFTFPFGIPAFPVIPGSVYFTDGTLGNTASDNGNGGFNAPLSGSIDYVTGTGSVTFATPPALGANILQASQTYMPNRPRGILYYKSMPLSDSTPATLQATNFFVLRPVPDTTYLIKMEGVQTPPILVNPTDVPFRPDLGPLIAYGASIEIFADFNQMDQIAQIQGQYDRYKDISMQDTYEEYLYQRSVPAF